MMRLAHIYYRNKPVRQVLTQCNKKYSEAKVVTATIPLTKQAPPVAPTIEVTTKDGPQILTQVASATTILPKVNVDQPKLVRANIADVGRVVQTTLDRPACSSFDEIPGPVSLKIISKFWSFVPVLSTEVTGGTILHVLNFGKFFGNILSWGGNAKFFEKFFNVYGPVVRLHGPFGGDVVLLSRPEHSNVVFQNEGVFPVRSCLDSLEKYRLEYRRLRQAGPFLMSGNEWDKLHKSIETPLSNIVDHHFDKIETTCDELVDRILAVRNLQEEVPKTFINELLKWSLECISSVTLNRRLGFLDAAGLSPTSDPGRILDGVNGAITAIRKCEYGFHIWKFMETPAWRSLVQNCDSIDSVLNKYVLRAQSSLKEKQGGSKDAVPANLSIIESLLLKEEFLVEDVMTVLLDMMLIGANATAHSVAFFMYHLAKNPRCQTKLFDEIQSQKGVINKDALKKMTYLQACLKESLRLKPPIPILNRILNQDALIYNYRIPKGTYVLLATHLTSLKEEYFENADKFMPERWFSPELKSQLPHGCSTDLNYFASIPFGHGPRACLARELAEVEINLLIVKVMKKFKIEYNYGEIESSNVLLAAPAKALNFRFVDRV